jgi:UMP-CMP kinase 2
MLGNFLQSQPTFRCHLDFSQRQALTAALVLRYWHSTASYAIATEVSGGLQHLPPVHHPVYQWPGDLLKPDLVLLLTVNPEERAQRLQGRGRRRPEKRLNLRPTTCFVRSRCPRVL